jgi:hypothetical protein
LALARFLLLPHLGKCGVWSLCLLVSAFLLILSVHNSTLLLFAWPAIQMWHSFCPVSCLHLTFHFLLARTRRTINFMDARTFHHLRLPNNCLHFACFACRLQARIFSLPHLSLCPIPDLSETFVAIVLQGKRNAVAYEQTEGGIVGGKETGVSHKSIAVCWIKPEGSPAA